MIPAELTTWGEWKRRHPQTLVLATPVGTPLDYRRDPYRTYFVSKELMFPVKPTSSLLPTKQPVLGVWTDQGARAYPLSMLTNVREPHPQQLGNHRFSIVFDAKSKSARVVDADDGVFWAYSFWFAWYAFHPQTEIFVPRGRKLSTTSEHSTRRPVVRLKPGTVPLANADPAGNPLGDQFGLARNGQFAGKLILMWSQDPDVWKYVFVDENPLFKALAEKGFRVRLVVDDFTPQLLQDVDQLWVFSNTTSSLGTDDVDAIRRFVEDGGGLYLLADNEPHLAEANVLAELFFSTRLSGDYLGQRVLDVRRNSRPTPSSVNMPAENKETNPNAESAVASAPLHPVLTGLNYVFEGDSISCIESTDKMVPILFNSEGELLLAAAAERDYRILVDGGWTRYARRYAQSAGSLRLAENAAAFLSGMRKRL